MATNNVSSDNHKDPRLPLGRDPVQLKCPHCDAKIITTIEAMPSRYSHCLAFVLIFVCCPLFWLPYCITGCQSTTHYCPNCNSRLGRYDPLVD